MRSRRERVEHPRRRRRRCLYGLVRERAEDRAAAVEEPAGAGDRERRRSRPRSRPRQPWRKPTSLWPYTPSPLRTTARITAFSPGQSPPPVSTPMRIATSDAVWAHRHPAIAPRSVRRRDAARRRANASLQTAGSVPRPRRGDRASWPASGRPTWAALPLVLRQRSLVRPRADRSALSCCWRDRAASDALVAPAPARAPTARSSPSGSRPFEVVHVRTLAAAVPGRGVARLRATRPRARVPPAPTGGRGARRCVAGIRSARLRPATRREWPSSLAIDAGTTGVRTLAVDEHGPPARVRVPRVPAALPAARAGSSTTPTTSGARPSRHPRRGRGATLDGETVAAIGITNQRETVVVWDRAHRRAAATARSSGRTAAPRRAATRCAPPGHEPLVRARDRARARPVLLRRPSSSGCSREGGVARRRRPRVRHRRHVDPVAPHRRPDGGVHATDPSNASRTLLYDIDALRLVRRAAATLFGVPRACLPEVRPSSGRFGIDRPDARRRPRGAGERHRRRPAGGAVRAGVLRARA